MNLLLNGYNFSSDHMTGENREFAAHFRDIARDFVFTERVHSGFILYLLADEEYCIYFFFSSSGWYLRRSEMSSGCHM